MTQRSHHNADQQQAGPGKLHGFQPDTGERLGQARRFEHKETAAAAICIGDTDSTSVFTCYSPPSKRNNGEILLLTVGFRAMQCVQPLASNLLLFFSCGHVHCVDLVILVSLSNARSTSRLIFSAEDPMLDSLCQASELQSHLVKSFITSIASKNYQLTSSCRIQLCDGFIQARGSRAGNCNLGVEGLQLTRGKDLCCPAQMQVS